MTNPTPDRLSLWRVMDRAAYPQPRPPRHNYRAAEIRAIADEMVMQFDPWLEEHAVVADWLETEARRAEQGDG